MHGGRYYVAILVILLVAYLLSLDKCPFSCFSGSDTQVEFAVAKLQKQANFGKSPALKRVAVGYNTNLDLACSGVSLLNKLGVDPHSLHNIQPYETIGNKEEFASSFGYFFQQGSAAERAASNMDLWNEILEPLQANNYKDCQVLPGGNAALISNRLAALNISVLLGGPVGKGLEPLINENIKTLKFYREERGAEQLSPVLDEVHLIMEFRTGEKWGPITSPRANRFIISHDLQNSHLTAIEEFHDAIEKFQPEVVIVAGSHLLEILPEAARAARMRTLVDALSNIPSHIAIHLEIAGVGDIEYLEEMARKLLPLVDSIGLNEQELGALYIATGGNQFSLDEFISPSVTVSSGALQHLIKLPYVEQGNGKHELNRIHLHYLSYHMIGQRISPRPGFFTWSKDNAARAVAAGSLATSTQACGTDGKLPDVSELHINSYATDLFSHFKTSSLEFWVAPVAVCNVPKRTVGLGDCISASGIAYHF